MEQKAFVLQNKGMNRDLSVSKTGDATAFENHNIRIIARDNDTLLSVTNERGNKEIDLGTLIGLTDTVKLVGWNVLNNHLILFTHEDGLLEKKNKIVLTGVTSGETTSISTIQLEPNSFNMKVGDTSVIKSYVVYSDNTRAEITNGTWDYDKPGIVNILPNGSVTALKEGTCRAFAYFNGIPIYPSATFTVSRHGVNPDPEPTPTPDPGPVEPTVTLNSLVLNHSSIEMDIEDSGVTLTCVAHYSDGTSQTVTPAWRSSNTRKATVDDDGFVVPVSKGTCTIKASYEDKVATCTVKVTKSGHEEPSDGIDRIYRIDYVNGEFIVVRGDYSEDKVEGVDYELGQPLYEGNLNFRSTNPIESIAHGESEAIQKIYWVDGRNPLRFINITASLDERDRWDDTSFDTNRSIVFSVEGSAEKDNAGNPRPNGVVQYLLTYYNLHGQESGVAWISDLIYLSPNGRGGAADENNTNRVVLTFSNLDTRFSHFRLYSIFRSSYDGQVTAYIVADTKCDDGLVTVIDDAAHLETIDPSSLLFLGSQNVIAGTMTHKDETLFLGDLQSIGKKDLGEFESDLRDMMFEPVNGLYKFVENKSWEARHIVFEYSDGSDELKDIPYVTNDGLYPYENQLKYTSSTITTFKGGEKYRFALVFFTDNGARTEAFWIGDKVNPLYPVIDINNKVVKRAVAKCYLPSDLIDKMKEVGFASVQLTIAEATYADRSVKAQGIVNPTMFNVWERYNNRLYSMPSWINRPRHSDFAWKHFEPVHNSTMSTGEIEANYWEGNTPTPYYVLENYGTEEERIAESYDGEPVNDYVIILYFCQLIRAAGLVIAGDLPLSKSDYDCGYVIIRGEPKSAGSVQTMKNCSFATANLTSESDTIETADYIITHKFRRFPAQGDSGLKASWAAMYDELFYNEDIKSDYIISETSFNNLVAEVKHSATWNGSIITYDYKLQTYARKIEQGIIDLTGSLLLEKLREVADIGNRDGRWYQMNTLDVRDNIKTVYRSSMYKKHLMFVDENIVTLNSPEIEQGLISFDNASGYKFRIVGAAKLSSVISDYTVDASYGHISGDSLRVEMFSSSNSGKNLNGLISWPLWTETSLTERKYKEDGETGYTPNEDIKKRTSYDYVWGGDVVHYWLHMWQRNGKISAYTDIDNNDYSTLRRKVFANLRYCYTTLYNNYDGYNVSYSPQSLRIFNYTSSQYLGLNVGLSNKYYDADIEYALSLPGNHKYPIIYSMNDYNRDAIFLEENNCYLYSSAPNLISFRSSAHAVISLGTVEPMQQLSSSYPYTQYILPYIFDSEKIVLPENTCLTSRENHGESGYVSGGNSGALLPWINTSIRFPWYTDALVYEYYTITSPYVMDTNTGDIIDGTISLSINYSGFTDTQREQFLSVYRYAVKDFNGEPVYIRVQTTDGCIYLADISKHRNDTAAQTIFLDNINVIARVAPGSTTRVVIPVTYKRNYSLDPTGSSSVVYLNVNSNTTTDYNKYKETDYAVVQPKFDFSGSSNVSSVAQEVLRDGDKYFYIGEIYYDYDFESSENPALDKRYGGISLSSVQANRFIAAGPRYSIADFKSDNSDYIVGNQGDTYFQRWDCFKTEPFSDSSVNGVIDLASVMVETHINMDGRTDTLRGISALASIKSENFGAVNMVYSQPDNYYVSRDINDELNEDSYRSTLTWTLQKGDAADIDAWTHITLASTLKLDADKGICRALRRFQNAIISFQDRGISEVMFNSNTQLATTNGVPVELANSGKVDGKRYITNRYGCVNKWSIVEGKAGLYFTDNTNKAFCVTTVSETGGRISIENLSAKLGFTAWFRKNNSTEVWTPEKFDNTVAFYDRIHSDVYLVKRSDNESQSCLVYNEMIGAFTSFFDYAGVPMMTNIEDKFISYRDRKIWLQNEGFYCNYFGEQYDFWMQYRITPEPYGDKIWTNLEYRADFYRMLDEEGLDIYEDGTDITDIDEFAYCQNETFDMLKIWNEYQTTGEFNKKPEKKFRIWRHAIPRAVTTDMNKHGLDRIRNPWINLLIRKNLHDDENRDLMQLHDIIVKYFE